MGPAKEFKEVLRGQTKCRLLIILPKYRFRENPTMVRFSLKRKLLKGPSHPQLVVF